MGRLGWEPRYLRHTRALLAHSNPMKLRNLARVETELRLRKVKLKSYPYLYFIDICNYCNLKCPLCPSSLNQFKQPRGMVDLADYKLILDQITDYALEVNLHNWGEPFLNPDVFEIIAYTRKKNIATNLSTNLNTLNNGQIEQIIRSGLEYLVVSLDGVSEEVYSRYRVRGNFKKALENLQALIGAKKKLRSRLPFIEWQFLVMKHNENQMAEAEEMARALRVDVLRFTSAGLPFEEFSNKELALKWMPTNSKYWKLNPHLLNGRRNFLINSNCFYLYRSLTVNPSGGVSPCCVLYDKRYDFGNLLKESLDEIWNNQWYLAARAVFSKEGSKETHTPCERCLLFRKPSLS